MAGESVCRNAVNRFFAHPGVGVNTRDRMFGTIRTLTWYAQYQMVVDFLRRTGDIYPEHTEYVLEYLPILYPALIPYLSQLGD